MVKFSRLVFFVFVFMAQVVMAKVIPGKYSSIPQYITLDKNTVVAIEELPGFMARNYKLPAGNGFKLLNKETDQLGITHYRYQQTVNNIPVEGTMYIAHVSNGAIQSLSGDLMDALQAVTSPAIDAKTAIEKALLYTAAQQYKWESAEAELALKDLSSDTRATYYPNPTLVYVAKAGKLSTKEFVLAYKMDIYAVKPLSRNYVFVDATTGEVVHTKNRIENVDVVATAQTQYSGLQAITTDSYNGSYRLREAARGNGIRTYNAQQSTNPGNTDFTNATTTWNNVNANKDQYATDAHFASEMTYDFYRNNFNRNSLDDNGLTLVSYVHYDQDLDNAFWDGGAMYYGDGDAVLNGTTPYTTLDIGGHEITHGLTQFTADLNYQDESGALNESFSDCMGIAIRQFVKQLANVDYRIGNDNGNTFRSLQNPKSYQQPDTYLGQYWYAGAQDNGGVHTNSGVQNHWFYVLAKGETG
nr:peptidase M4 family protein [Chitinophagales bacterium]